MTKVGTAYVDVEARTSKLESGVKSAAEGIKSHLGGAFAAVAATAGGVFAGVKVAEFLKGTIEDYREAAKVGRLTNAVVQSTGGVAGVSAAGVKELADSLARKIGVDEDVIASGENVLLTFTNIRNEAGKGNDIFDQATVAATNLSAALGQDLQSSVIQIGKALNDPVKGVTALQRVGVSFTAQQRDQISALAESGNLLGAQKVILGELTKEFGGAAQAAADPMAQLGVVTKQFREELGGALFPLVSQIAPVIGQVLPEIGASLSSAFGAIIPAITPVITAIGPILGQLGETIGALVEGIAPALVPIAKVISDLAPIIGQVGAAIVPVVQAIALGIGAMAPVITPVARLLADLLTNVLAALLPPLEQLVPLWQQNAGVIAGALGSALKAIAPALPPLAQALGQVAAAVGKDLANALKALAPALPALANLVRIGADLIARIPPPVLTKLVEAFLLFRTVGPGLTSATKGLEGLNKGAQTFGKLGTAENLTKLKGGFTTLGQTLGGRLSPALGLAQKAWTALSTSFLANPVFLVVAAIVALGVAVVLAYQHFEPFRRVVDDVGRFLRDVFVAALHFVLETLANVGDWITGHWPIIVAVLTGPIGIAVALIVTHFGTIRSFILGVLGHIGAAWSGLWNGMSSVVSGVLGSVEGAARGVINAVIGVLNAGVRFINRAFQIHLNLDVPDWLPGLPNRLKFDYDGPHIPQIPTLHSGGIFRAPVGATEGLALLRNGETVLTPAQLEALTTSSGTPAVQVGALYAWSARDAAEALFEEATYRRLAGV